MLPKQLLLEQARCSLRVETNARRGFFCFVHNACFFRASFRVLARFVFPLLREFRLGFVAGSLRGRFARECCCLLGFCRSDGFGVHPLTLEMHELAQIEKYRTLVRANCRC